MIIMESLMKQTKEETISQLVAEAHTHVHTCTHTHRDIQCTHALVWNFVTMLLSSHVALKI